MIKCTCQAGESEGEAQTWLVDENVLAHFESLKLEATEAVYVITMNSYVWLHVTLAS